MLLISECSEDDSVFVNSRDVTEYIIAMDFVLKRKRIVKSNQTKSLVWEISFTVHTILPRVHNISLREHLALL